MKPVPPVPRLPYVLLAGLTVVAFAGPLAMLLVIRGGPSAGLPPDRAIEWVVIALVFGLFIVLFFACISINWWHPGLRESRKPKTNNPAVGNRPTIS